MSANLWYSGNFDIPGYFLPPEVRIGVLEFALFVSFIKLDIDGSFDWVMAGEVERGFQSTVLNDFLH